MSFHSVALEGATHRTLHAHGFSRSSTQAALVLTDLLSRYITLLSATCAKYSQHAGRKRLTPRDAFCALDELGVSVDELSEYCLSEGKELGHYAFLTARRVEDLNELKLQLADGRKQDRDDVIPLVYAPVPLVVDESDNDEDENGDEDEELMDLDVDDAPSDGMIIDSPMDWRRPPTLLPMPLSPSFLARKRPRTLNWQPPPHIPDFLPPFPRVVDIAAQPPILPPPPVPPIQPPVRIEKPPSPIPQSVASTSSSDYLTRVPYNQSTLSAVPEWHLPSSCPPAHPLVQMKPSCLATPPTESSLITAYHHILTHPPTTNSNSPNPSRHKVAMALLAYAQNSPRWDPPDTIFSSTSPCVPRTLGTSPTFPILVGKAPSVLDNKPIRIEDDDKDPKFPITLGRPVSFVERLSPSISQQASRIPQLARHVLSPSVHMRTTRLSHPPPLVGNGQKLMYGPGVPAPWNTTSTPLSSTPVVTKPMDGAVNGILNNKVKETPKILQDATLFATWDYEKKDFRQPLTSGRRGRMASAQGSSGGVLSVGAGTRARSGSKVG